MNAAEIFIAHTLYGNPDATYVTLDGEKLYFLFNGHLMYVEASFGETYNDLSEDELKCIRDKAILELTSSH